jgi:hypothetical protein
MMRRTIKGLDTQKSLSYVKGMFTIGLASCVAKSMLEEHK